MVVSLPTFLEASNHTISRSSWLTSTRQRSWPSTYPAGTTTVDQFQRHKRRRRALTKSEGRVYLTANLRAQFAIHTVLIQQRFESCDRCWATLYSAYLEQGDQNKARTDDKETKKRPSRNHHFYCFVFQNFRQCEPQARQISAPRFFESFFPQLRVNDDRQIRGKSGCTMGKFCQVE